MTEELRQGINTMVIIGTLKELEINEGQKDGIKSISLNATIASTVGDKVHENKINFYARENSKLYKGYKTMADEYAVGKDRVQIRCSLERNRFKSNGEIVEFNRIRGVFASRVDNAETPDQVGGILECVPISITDEMKDGEMTGRKIAKVYTVGYNNRINTFDLVIGSDLAQQFSTYYPLGCTAEMVVELNRYVKVKPTEQQAQPAEMFFGKQLDTMPDAVVESWVNEVEVIGGRQPKVEPEAYTAEEIAEIKRLDELQLQELKSQSPTPPTGNSQTVFGKDPFQGDDMTTPNGDDDFPF